MKLLQASHRYPQVNDPKLIEYITERIKHSFYEELDRALADTPGGLLVAQPQLTTKIDNDWLFETGDYVTVTYSTTVEQLPTPPEYRLIGGPADGHIVRTHGERIWLVPYFANVPSAASYAEPAATIPRLVAEYERQGNTAVYFYARTNKS